MPRDTAKWINQELMSQGYHKALEGMNMVRQVELHPGQVLYRFIDTSTGSPESAANGPWWLEYEYFQKNKHFAYLLQPLSTLILKYALSIPPILRAYQRIPFQNSYKDGLERLMQELQPEQMAQLAGWYRQLQQAMGRNDWALVQKLGAQITANYPDYRETEERLALARRETEREQANQAEAARLYPRLKRAVGNNDWANALALADQIDQLVPNYQNVAQLREHAARATPATKPTTATTVAKPARPATPLFALGFKWGSRCYSFDCLRGNSHCLIPTH